MSGQVTLTADGVGGSIDVQARFPFKDLVAGGIYSVIVTQDSENPTNTDDQGLVWTGGIFTNSGVASLYIATEVTGLAVSGVAIISYFITRVG
ncbi:MAG: hypothetical protein ACRDUW_06530 [Pseudonocardiaceae bacterium]